MSKILVYLEKNKETLKRSSLELITAARDLAKLSGDSTVGLFIGNPEPIKDLAKEYGLEEILFIDNNDLNNYSSTAYAAVIAQTVISEDIKVVLFSANAAGLELAPRVSIKINAGYIADCVKLEYSNNELIATKPVYAGKALIKSIIKNESKVLSLRPNVFTAQKNETSNISTSQISPILTEKDFAAKVNEIKRNEGKLDVSEAEIIVSGGRGLKGPENYNIIENLATVLGGAVGASRAVVDAGWRPHAEQVGQTGKTVSPNLYVAVAISGAVQHLAGMSTSKVILSINKDKDAPIFKVSDYGIIGDIFEVVPKLTNKIKEIKS